MLSAANTRVVTLLSPSSNMAMSVDIINLMAIIINMLFANKRLND